METPIIKVEEVNFQYLADKEALRSVSLEIFSGEFVAFAGQNGAGKTTCAKLLNGIFKPTTGTVSVDGIDTKTVPSSEIARTVGYCYQNPDHQIWALKVEDELAFGPRNLGLSSEEVKNRVNEALELVGLDGQRDDYTFSLGWGERQKLAVAAILAMRPQVIVVDEPTTGLDWEGSIRIMELLKKLNESGLTVIIITHDMEVVTAYTRRIIVFADGQIVADGPVAEIMYDQEALAAADLRPPQFIRMAIALRGYGFAQSVMSAHDFKATIVSLMEKRLNRVNK